ncbi:DUF4259 domain-containing protein [Actinomadura sp. KC06]|uniref:DUF4259 domain-containing protein n=1 Tax=Actinomadura sp. KC06 TaxID=2530369 RepID=UPI00104F27F5|nr:DUF4259 domain-containing protein [Actinomadura sp. KC06]TDD26382.1 DUF4259 domain-containing protein [Actinomadura sp. KC06]
MGTWDATPFGNDTAADFAGDLDDLALDERPAAVREALEAAIREAGYLDRSEGDTAVAAAALVAAQCPGGPPADAIYGPDEPVPPLPDDFRPLALAALDRVAGANSESQELWAETADGLQRWQAEIDELRKALRP